MAITAAELIAFNCASRPVDDTSTGGGAVDLESRPSFTHWSANAVAAFQSSSGSDTQNCTVEGRLTTGAVAQETFALTGLTEKLSSNTYERILWFDLASDAIGTITVKQGSGGTTRYTIPIGEQGAASLFQRSASEAGATTRYDKIFWRNTNGTLTLNSAQVRLTADPSSKIRQGVHTSKGDSATITNRKTAPGGVTFVDDAVDQAVPTNTLAASENIGVWIELQLTGSDTPYKSTFTHQLSGTSI